MVKMCKHFYKKSEYLILRHCIIQNYFKNLDKKMADKTTNFSAGIVISKKLITDTGKKNLVYFRTRIPQRVASRKISCDKFIKKKVQFQSKVRY